MFYAGVGSRRTPADILVTMRRLSEKLRIDGWILRSGGAAGADSAFARGAGPDSEIYRPEHATRAALEMAAKHHPAWDRCSDYAKRLHARNCFQVLGRDLNDPVRFLTCWTPDGAVSSWDCSIATGGTGMAIRIAYTNGVQIRNLSRQDHLDRALEYLTRS